MPPAALSVTYCTSSDVENLLSASGVVGRLDDDEGGTNSGGELAYLTQAINWATARVNLYVLSRHAAADLANSFVVNWYCTVIAAYLVSGRRGNPVASPLAEAYEEVMGELKAVRAGELTLADVATRDHSFPAWSNQGAPDHRYQVQKLRVQRYLSGRKGDRSGQADDAASRVLGDSERSW